MSMTRFSKTLLAGAVALACAAPASAQWNGFVFFGDSLTDAGTFAPSLPPGTGRFTTNPDPVWAQVLGARYGFTITPATSGGTDYAQGGARVAQLPGYPANAPFVSTAIPVTTQVQQAVARGIDPNALYAVWAGANDVSTQLTLAASGQITAAQAQAAVVTAATQLVQQVGVLQAAGVKTVAVGNLPDMGRTPSGQSLGAAGAAQLSALANLYNATLAGGLNALGGNVLRIDNWSYLNDMIANPASYGITNVTAAACGTTPALVCTRASLVTPNANTTYAFADGNHPTGAAHVILAQTVASLLEAPSQAATLTQGPLAVEQATWRTVDARMWSAMDTPYDPKRGMNFWAAYDYSNPDIDTGFATGDADLNTLSVGGDMRIGQNWLVGAAANFSGYKASYSGGSHKLNETSGTIYAGWGDGPWYAGASALIGALDYKDVDRSFAIGTGQREESGSTSGTHWAFRLHGGYWLRYGSLNHGPFAKLVWQRADVDAYAESVGTVTALRYGPQQRDSLLGSLGWQVQGAWGAVRPFARVTWEYDFKDDAPEVSATPLTGGGTYQIALPTPDNSWALFNVGASMDFGAGSATFGKVTGYLMGTATAGKSDGDAWALTLGMRVPF
jgi:outer membrane lipase/esterase